MLVLDYEQINFGAHTLKGASGYVGAAKLHYACYYIQDAYHRQGFQEMVDRYPSIVEAVIEFKRFLNKYAHEAVEGES